MQPPFAVVEVRVTLVDDESRAQLHELLGDIRVEIMGDHKREVRADSLPQASYHLAVRIQVVLTYHRPMQGEQQTVQLRRASETIQQFPCQLLESLAGHHSARGCLRHQGGH